MSIAACKKCGEHTYVTPLHGDNGGPLFCPVCAGYWHAEQTRRRRAGRVVIKAMDIYLDNGGKHGDLQKMALCTGGFGRDWARAIIGYEVGSMETETGYMTSELLADTIELCHPDKHPSEGRDSATRVTQELLVLKPFVFPAPKAKPAPTSKPRDDKVKVATCHSKEPSQEPAYPCGECADTIPYYYCTPCKTEYDKRRREERERENAKQREQYARRQRWRRASRPPKMCARCETKFEPKRKDAKYCSHVCRQKAYRGRRKADNQASKTDDLHEDRAAA